MKELIASVMKFWPIISMESLLMKDKWNYTIKLYLH